MTIVCVLDRGCNMSIPFLRSVAYPGFTTGGVGDDSEGKNSEITTPTTIYTHGTYCAGIVARTYTANGGTPGDLRIMPVALKNLTIPEVVEGINEAIKKGAQIISVSQEFPPGWPTADIDKVIEGAFKKNILVCVATGNADSSISYPATHPLVMAVGACDGHGNRVTKTHPLRPDMTWGSNFGPKMSVVARGLEVDTTYLGGSYKVSFDKTSAAAPQVAGLAALILSAYPSLSNTDMRALIERNADHPNGGRNNDIGYGHINISRTISALDRLKGVWSATGSLMTPRGHHTATLLPTGKVLVVGGPNSNPSLPSAELYDPAKGTWSETGELMTHRLDHTATLLLTGKVLVAGGPGSSPSLPSAELYDPEEGRWRATGDLMTRRSNHTATLLPNGEVLVAGGTGSNGTLASAELYDPKMGVWRETGALITSRRYHNATLLPNGMVLVVGGEDYDLIRVAELYNPGDGRWSATGSPHITRVGREMTILLRTEEVLVAGETGSNGAAELYNPETKVWRETGALRSLRFSPATLLPSGRVLVAGGSSRLWQDHLASADLYDPTTGSWSATGDLMTRRSNHTATLLPNGQVLVAGGGERVNFLASAELFTFVLPAEDDTTPPAHPVNVVVK